jgi:hypothetical protein
MLQDWRTFARSIGLPVPQRGGPMSAELERLLTDPYVVTVKPKKTKGTRETRSSKGLSIRDNLPELPMGSQPSSGSDSDFEQ